MKYTEVSFTLAFISKCFEDTIVENMPQITCPKCGTTINLENRKNIDYGKILNALQKNPKTFTELLKSTCLPRKTLSLRLKALRNSGIITNNGGWHLNGASLLDMPGTRTRQLWDTHTDWKKLLQVMTLMLIISLSTGSLVSALMTKISEPTPLLSPVASFTISPNPPYYIGWADTLTFDASSSYDHAGNIISYKWSFFQSYEFRESSLKEVGNSEGMITTYVFTTPGHYIVVLTVTDNDGKSTSERRHITIHPTPCAKVYVDPPNVTGVAIGDSFTVSIAVQDVTDLIAWQVGATFNPDILECVTVSVTTYDEEGNIITEISAFEEGPFLKQGGKTDFAVPWTIYSEKGKILYHCCCLDSLETTVTPVSGSGILAYITFKVIGQGDSVLHLTDVMLLNPDVLEIPILILEDGYFQSP